MKTGLAKALMLLLVVLVAMETASMATGFKRCPEGFKTFRVSPISQEAIQEHLAHGDTLKRILTYENSFEVCIQQGTSTNP